MARLNKSRYNVKRALQSAGRRASWGQIRRTPAKAPENARRLRGDDAPELICECSVIPFPHFFSQCWELQLRESAIGHDADA